MKAMAVLLAGVLAASAAFAQPPAVSPDLSPEVAAEIFRNAVTETCVPAVRGGGVSALPEAQRGRLQPTNNPETRQQAGAGPDETVWDVMDGKGVVTLREKAGRCVVSVYGPAASKTIASVAQALTGPAGFERLTATQSPGALGQTLSASAGGKSVMVRLTGSEPGTPGHQSRFSVVTATVFLAQ
ncbi:MAG: hypothetical protein QM773_06410 [Hyphomonadaceae bacterium]